MKPPLFLIIGWAHRATCLAELTERLKSRHSVTTLSPHDLDLGAYAECMVDRLRDQDAPVTLVGWSLGGMIAVEAARQATDQVNHLVLISATARFCKDDDYAPGTPVAELRALTQSFRSNTRAALDGFLRYSAAPHEPLDSPLDSYAERLEDALAIPLDSLVAGLEYLARTDLRDQRNLPSCRTCLVHGAQDQVIPVGASEFLLHALPRAQRQVHPNSGHDLPLRHPSWVAETIAHFNGLACPPAGTGGDGQAASGGTSA